MKEERGKRKIILLDLQQYHPRIKPRMREYKTADIRLFVQIRGRSYPPTQETDLLMVQNVSPDSWIPRVVVECKTDSVTTHDAITYSEKAFTHKRVHPYLRYGVILGNRRTYPLPGRLFRQGLYFDFMASWISFQPTESELDILLDILIGEVNASQNLQEMIFESRSSSRENTSRYTVHWL